MTDEDKIKEATQRLRGSRLFKHSSGFSKYHGREVNYVERVQAAHYYAVHPDGSRTPIADYDLSLDEIERLVQKGYWIEI